MKTRFMKAILHELPGADFQSAAGESRQRFHILEKALTPAPCHSMGDGEVVPASDQVAHAQSCEGNHSALTERAHSSLQRECSAWWQFASLWRDKPADNFAPAEQKKKFFRCLTAGIASALMLCVVGCESNGYVLPSKNDRMARFEAPADAASKAG